jgi:predicted nucleic acid-binding protein
MPILVDTNVIADVLYCDPVWEAWSDAKITQHAGDLYVNPMIYAELSYRATSTGEVERIIASLGLRYEELPRHALFLAAKAYRTYRQQGGVKTAPLPDFFIGAHAEASGIPILTRDQSRYRTYFPTVPLICP